MRYAAILFLVIGCAHSRQEFVGEEARPRLLSVVGEMQETGLVLVSGDRAFILPRNVVTSERRALAAALSRTISAPPVGHRIRIPDGPAATVRSFEYPNRFLEVESNGDSLVVQRVQWRERDGYWIVCHTGQGDRFAFLTAGNPELDSAWDRIENRASELAGDVASGPPLFLPLEMPSAGAVLRSVGVDLRGYEGKIEVQGTTFEVVR